MRKFTGPAGLLVMFLLMALAGCRQSDPEANALFESVQEAIHTEGTATAESRAATGTAEAATGTAVVAGTMAAEATQLAAATGTAIAETEATEQSAATGTAMVAQTAVAESEAATAEAGTRMSVEAAEATEAAGTRLANQMIATLNAQYAADAYAALNDAAGEGDYEPLVSAAEEYKLTPLGPFAEQIAHDERFWPELWLLALVTGLDPNDLPGDPEIPFFDHDNFIAEVNFGNPYALSTSGWDYGLLFRVSAQGIYFLVIFSNGDWELRYDPDVESNEEEPLSLQAGRVPEFDNAEGGANRIKLYVFGERGVLFINGQFAGNLNLSDQLTGMGILLATGFYAGNQQEGAVTRFEDFTVWPLPEE